ncbi:hypothetical protein DKX38_025877 [Salix brachista]|uniref:Retrotransposon Copia-like N-terminal domain-containing protein n=1 Tax=Salix brachista TaxID=2182728 RepID=A0A5N5JQ86_9ROSI|nr:hypothetical protein DKX38_025877 [Salix brachista]
MPVETSTLNTNLNTLPFGFKLNESNFKIWSRMIELHAAGLNKLGYLTGKDSRVEEGNSGYSKWCTEDAVVRGWLLKTMEPHLIGLFIDLSSAKEIWDSVTQTFYDGADESQFYELRCKATRTKQGGRPVNLYYAELNSVWQEIDKRRPIKMTCAADLRTRQEEIQKDRIYDFLAGLDDVFDPIRSDLLRTKSVPSIEECFNTIRREAQRQVTMMGTKTTGESSSMAIISKTPFKSRNFRAIEEAEKDKLRCSHCNGNRHTKDTCFEIHGYPDWFLEKRKQSKTKSMKRPVQTKQTESPSSFAALTTSQEKSEPCQLDQTANPSSATGNAGGEMENDAYNWIDLPQPSEQPDAGEEHPSSSGEEAGLITTGEGIELSNEGEEVENSTGKGENEFSNKEAVVHNEITPSSPQIHVQDRPDIHEVSNTENSSACTLLPTSCYSLPPRQNRGKPPDRYSPNGKISYAITNFRKVTVVNKLTGMDSLEACSSNEDILTLLRGTNRGLHLVKPVNVTILEQNLSALSLLQSIHEILLIKTQKTAAYPLHKDSSMPHFI